MQKIITLLGSTGSIGKSTLEIVRQHPQSFTIDGLSCYQNLELMLKQILEFKPRVVCVGTQEQQQQLQKQIPPHIPTQVIFGPEGLLELATLEKTELVVTGIVGAAGLKPTYAAIEAGKDIALANKEPMVLAGAFIMEKAKETGSTILPTDSEHNAIFQSLVGHRHEDIESLILTASGGPFRELPLEEFKNIRLEDALKHPNWSMGSKITIDCATMMNKGLEVIEARWLFDIPVSQIDVVVHKESTIHSLVQYVDGSVLAQLGAPDMQIPISYCLAYPERLPINVPRLDLPKLKHLHFEEVSMERFPCLQLAMDAAQATDASAAVLNGANESVVAAYLEERIHFTDIPKLLKQTMESFKTSTSQTSAFRNIQSIEDAIAADTWGRHHAEQLIRQPSSL